MALNNTLIGLKPLILLLTIPIYATHGPIPTGTCFSNELIECVTLRPLLLLLLSVRYKLITDNYTNWGHVISIRFWKLKSCVSLASESSLQIVWELTQIVYQCSFSEVSQCSYWPVTAPDLCGQPDWCQWPLLLEGYVGTLLHVSHSTWPSYYCLSTCSYQTFVYQIYSHTVC